jgi:hypothetical protein
MVASQLPEAPDMNGALGSVSAFGPISFLIAFVGSALTLILIVFMWFGPRRFRMPAVVPGIPLALISIALQVLIGAFGIQTAFREIVTQRLFGVRYVAGSIAVVTGAFTTAIALSIGCVVALLIFQAISDRRDEQTEWSEPEDKLAPRIAFFLTALSALAALALLWFFERTVDIIMLVVDASRKAEAQQTLGHMRIGEAAAMISHRLLLCEAFSFALVALFLTAPFSLMAGEAPEWVRVQSWTLAILTALCLIPFGIVFHQDIVYMISLTHPR